MFGNSDRITEFWEEKLTQVIQWIANHEASFHYGVIWITDHYEKHMTYQYAVKAIFGSEVKIYWSDSWVEALEVAMKESEEL